jgi:hypothetical protein
MCFSMPFVFAFGLADAMHAIFPTAHCVLVGVLVTVALAEKLVPHQDYIKNITRNCIAAQCAPSMIS